MPPSIFDFETPCDDFAVMGNPIKHSQSPYIHRLFSQQTEKNISYHAIHVDLGGFSQAVGNFQANGGSGLNITVPFKHEAWKLASGLSPRAKLAKAVNTLKFNSDGSILGDNTDGIGLVIDIKKQGYALKGKNILILGAGGAVCGILAPLLDEHPACIHIANRSIHKAEALVQHISEHYPETTAEGTLSTQLSASGYDALSAHSAYDLIINGTSASLSGDLPPIHSNLIAAQKSLCYDLMYAAQPTAFMQWGRDNDAGKTLDGLGMLVEQAAASFQLWLNVKPNTVPVLSQLRQHIQNVH